jgi:phosphohistidine phosphatase SixA
MNPGMIITSPYKRTLETAKIAALILNFKEPLKSSRALMPDSSPQAVWDEIRTHKNEEQILLVGHEPLFGYLAAFLLNSSAMRLDFKKGAILRIDVSQFAAQAHGELKWYLTPKIAEGLAK